MPLHLTVSLYNSAGERVRLLFEGASASGPQSLSLSASAFQAGQALAIHFAAPLSQGGSALAWQGENDNGQWVEGGAYYVKAEYRDAFGGLSSVIAAVQVLPPAPLVQLLVSNSAGELVRRLDLPAGASAADFRLGSDAFAAVAGQSLAVYFQDAATGAEQPVLWDGLNERGLPVSAGVYSLSLRGGQGSQTSAQVKTVTVLRVQDGAAAGVAMVSPNPARSGRSATVFYRPAPAATAVASLYNAAGELVRSAADPARGGRVALDLVGLAPGVYVVVLDQRIGGGSLARSALKLALLP